ncbi:MAG: cytochrome c peroxidase, partial [Bacteroidota bacterium]
MNTKLLFPLLLFIIVSFTSCLNEERESIQLAPSFTEAEFTVISSQLNIGPNIDPFAIELPQHMARGSSRPQQVNAAKALLGRVLFYDNQLSATGETNCASCHLQEAAFSDVVDFSEGINGQRTKRNSLALAATPNFATSYGSSSIVDNDIVDFFWDERASSIAEQSRETIENEIEMGRDINELAADLNGQELYRILAEKAFRNTQITPHVITESLQEFCNSLVSASSRFDRLMDQEIFGDRANNEPRWTAIEQQGRALYNRDCASCHSFDMSFPGRATANNGLDVVYVDKGKGEVFGSTFNGIFKVPFLRNIELTAPYMHDGRFATLEEVLDHYSENIQNHPNLSFDLKDFNTLQPKRFNYT